jgi:hypothetical protein
MDSSGWNAEVLDEGPSQMFAESKDVSGSRIDVRLSTNDPVQLSVGKNGSRRVAGVRALDCDLNIRVAAQEVRRRRAPKRVERGSYLKTALSPAPQLLDPGATNR